MATQEFSFPITLNTGGAFIGSPPLWTRTSSSKETERIRQQKSFSEVETGFRNLQHRPIEMDGHDRMDLLWEDFNEEIRRKQNPFISESALPSSSSDDLVVFGCVPSAFHLSRSVNGGGSSSKGVEEAIFPPAVGGSRSNNKVAAVALAKVLKRLFFLRHQHVKKRPW